MEASDYDCIVIGSGFSGATVASLLGRKGGKKVLVLEKKPHLGGLAFDCAHDSGLLVHPYGPHIFHTNNQEVVSFLSAFTQWRAYTHHVAASYDGRQVPLPFSLRSLYKVFSAEKAAMLEQKLLACYPYGQSISIRALQGHEDGDLAALGAYVYENVYQHYSQKQWGTSLDRLDSFVADRLPFRLSHDERYFQDSFQALPQDGYLRLFERMLDHKNITVRLDCDAMAHLRVRDDKLIFDGNEMHPQQQVICTASLDSLFQFEEGALPFRSVSLSIETVYQQWFQPFATVNYTKSEAFTRITEFKHMTGEQAPITVIAREFPQAYADPSRQMPAYPIPSRQASALYARYRARAGRIANLHCAGRLAQYRYLNMDESVARAISLGKSLIQG